MLYQGTLTEGVGTVRLTSLRQLACKEVKRFVISVALEISKFVRIGSSI
jgi:hypothetical protein